MKTHSFLGIALLTIATLMAASSFAGEGQCPFPRKGLTCEGKSPFKAKKKEHASASQTKIVLNKAQPVSPSK